MFLVYKEIGWVSVPSSISVSCQFSLCCTQIVSYPFIERWHGHWIRPCVITWQCRTDSRDANINSVLACGTSTETLITLIKYTHVSFLAQGKRQDSVFRNLTSTTWTKTEAVLCIWLCMVATQKSSNSVSKKEQELISNRWKKSLQAFSWTQLKKTAIAMSLTCHVPCPMSFPMYQVTIIDRFNNTDKNNAWTCFFVPRLLLLRFDKMLKWKPCGDNLLNSLETVYRNNCHDS